MIGVGRCREEAVKSSYTLLGQGILSDPEELGILHKIARLIYNRNWGAGDAAAEVITDLWNNKLFSIPGKKEILRAVAEGLPKASYGQEKALEVLLTGVRSGLMPDFDIISNVMTQVSEPAPVGIEAEKFIRVSLRISRLPDWRKDEISLELREQISIRRSLQQRQVGDNEACQGAMQSRNR